jgi:cell division protein ZapA
MSDLSIQAQIAGRTYPLKVSSAEQHLLEKALGLLTDRLQAYESRFQVRDKQDLLAMCALELARSVQAQTDLLETNSHVLQEAITETENQIANYLQQHT